MNKKNDSLPYEQKLQLARTLFKAHDTDKSGYLDIDELTDAMNELMKLINYNYVCTVREIESMLKHSDKNGDNRLSLKEFMDVVNVFVRTK
jgi:Ca2+-binding EF-hand superfamily protein